MASEARQISPLNESTRLLGDRAALDAAWSRDGYWFFRNVLDKEAVARFRGLYLNVLAAAGVARADDPDAHYTGAALTRLSQRMGPLHDQKAWRSFVSEPAIHAFFTDLLQDQPFWLPTPEYRATPPSHRDAPRLDGVHQDGVYNGSIPFLTCWIPLTDIDAEVGGLEVAEGMHQEGYLPMDEALNLVPEGLIPPDRWRRADYRPGDLLMMDIYTPHSGCANYSDRFRLSMDVRVLPASGETPAIGPIAEVDDTGVVVKDHDGRLRRFRFDDRSYVRDRKKQQIEFTEIPDHYEPGVEVIVGGRDGLATLLRPLV